MSVYQKLSTKRLKCTVESTDSLYLKDDAGDVQMTVVENGSPACMCLDRYAAESLRDWLTLWLANQGY